VGRELRGRGHRVIYPVYNISQIGIVTMNCPLYNEYILIKILLKRKTI
jgi:hypothetical protein